MRIRSCLLTCVLLRAYGATAQDSDQMLARIRGTMAANLGRLPNYTCTEMIERSTRSLTLGQVMLLETIRLEVAFMDGHELFGWPGAAKIDQPDIGKMIDGAIGNGYFALFSKSIFATPSATFRFVAETNLNGKKAIRYDYVVPKASQAYHLKSDFGEVVVKFHGSFWVNAETLDLVRITVDVDDPPLALGISGASSLLNYDRQTIGGKGFVLPRSAELSVITTEQVEDRSRLSFQACHEFVGESVLKFDEPSEEKATAPTAPVATVTLPGDFTVDFNLETPIEWRETSGGDPVRGILREDVRSGDVIIVPKGAKLSGRIAHIALRGDLYYVELVLTVLEFAGGRAELGGRRNGISVKNIPLIYKSTHFKLGAGARLTLHSRLLKSVHNDSIRP